MDTYFATILIERNRWAVGKVPTYCVTDWMERIRDAGYAGIELWENHGLTASLAERKAIRRAFPVVLFNTYDSFTADTAEHRQAVVAAIRQMGAIGCKFNFGNDVERLDEYRRSFRAWAANLPRDVRLICECHGNTVCEEPEAAARILGSLDDPRVEALVHAKTPPEKLEAWFDALGDRITHCHVNLFRCGGDPWRHPELIPFDFRESLARIARSSIRTMSLEFTEGVGDEAEDMEVLFDRAARDMARIREITGA